MTPGDERELLRNSKETLKQLVLIRQLLIKIAKALNVQNGENDPKGKKAKESPFATQQHRE